MVKNLSFFELKSKMKLEATDELIKLMERKHQYKKLAELVKFREELKCSNKDITAAAGAVI